MTCYQCMRCGHWWATNCGARHVFWVISKYCPDCVTVILPAIGKIAA